MTLVALAGTVWAWQRHLVRVQAGLAPLVPGKAGLVVLGLLSLIGLGAVGFCWLKKQSLLAPAWLPVLAVCIGAWTATLYAIAARCAGAAAVTAVDVDVMAGTVIPLNAALNGARIQVTCGDLLVRPAPEVDVILAGDVCYEEEMAEQMLPWLRDTHRRGTRVLLGDPGRHFFPREVMTLLAEYDVPTTWEVEGAELKRTGVYTFA